MEYKFTKSPVGIGFMQAVGVLVYVALVATLVKFIQSLGLEEGGTINIVFVLTLLVFSAAITGSLVFGYPAYMALNDNVKKALQVLGYTLMFLFLLLVIVFAVMAFFNLSF